MNRAFETLDLSEFWESSEYANREYVCGHLTEDRIKEVEAALGYLLPRSYIELMQTQNGGFPKNTAAPSKERASWADDHVAITGIFGIGSDKQFSLCGSLGSQFMIDEWGYPDIGVYICDCPSSGHDMVGLDYRNCGSTGEPKVVHVDQECGYKTTTLAATFEEFILSLKSADYYDAE